MVSRRSLLATGFSVHFEHPEVDLVHVEGVGFKGAVFDGPVFDGSDFGCDDGLFVGFEDLLLLSVDGDVELDRAVGAAELFREIELALRGRGLLGKAAEFGVVTGGLGRRRHLGRCSRVAGCGLDRRQDRTQYPRFRLDRCRRCLSQTQQLPEAGACTMNSARPAGWNENRGLSSGLRERIAIQSDHLQRNSDAIHLYLQRQESLKRGVGDTPELFFSRLHVDDRCLGEKWRSGS